jgi:hypothetical protein
MSKGRDYLELGDLPVSAAEIMDVQTPAKANIFGFPDHVVSIK